MSDYLEKTAVDIAQNREEVIDRLAQFALSDMLLFWGQNKDLIERQEATWGPLLVWASEKVDANFKKTHNLDVPEQPEASGAKMLMFLNSLNNRELAAFYVAALNMKSVLLAAALIKGRINAEQAFEAANLEEIWQAENWGVEEEAEKRRLELKRELIEVEQFLKK